MQLRGQDSFFIISEMPGAGSKSRSGDLMSHSVPFYAVEPGKSFEVGCDSRIRDGENVDVLPFQTWEPELTENYTKGSVYKINFSRADRNYF